MLVDFRFNQGENLFILGAGSSVDYGLPTWNQLADLIKNKINNDSNNKYNYKTEIIEWLDMVGDNKSYKTIDECISSESISQNYHDNGDEIEDEIFSIMNEVFNDCYKDNKNGWINKLNNILIYTPELGRKISFINYNYDNVLNRNLLNFDYLPKKDRKVNLREYIDVLSSITVKSFHPHGHFPVDDNSNIYNIKNTPKSDLEGDYIDVVSCHDSNIHKINSETDSKLYILGLGGGLKFNLDRLEFNNRISEIHITVRKKELVDDIKDFLSKKFGLGYENIKIYDNCDDLINYCFGIPF